jgi:hypothetical protein
MTVWTRGSPFTTSVKGRTGLFAERPYGTYFVPIDEHTGGLEVGSLRLVLGRPAIAESRWTAQGTPLPPTRGVSAL